MLKFVHKALIFGFLVGQGAADNHCFDNGGCPPNRRGERRHCGWYVSVTPAEFRDKTGKELEGMANPKQQHCHAESDCNWEPRYNANGKGVLIYCPAA